MITLRTLLGLVAIASTDDGGDRGGSAPASAIATPPQPASQATRDRARKKRQLRKRRGR